MNRTRTLGLCVAAALAASLACKKDDRPRASDPVLSPPPGGAAPAAPALPSQIAALEGLAAKEPQNAQLWIQLGNLYFDSHQYQKSVDAYAKALAIQPNNPDVLTDQGVMYRELKQVDKAVENFEKAQQVAPAHVQSAFNLGVVYAYDLNLPDKAAAAWNKVLTLAPNSPQAGQARQALAELEARRGPAAPAKK
jgi:tetratricopeptide (TPR) repeat protein